MSNKGQSKFNRYREEVEIRLKESPEVSNSALARLVISLYPNNEIDYDAFRQWIGYLKKSQGGVVITRRAKDPTKLEIIPEPKKERTKPKEEPPAFVMSAWNPKTGQVMGIDEYCAHYNQPRENVKKYKLVSHTGTPYYNVEFNTVIDEAFEKDFDGIIDKVVAKHIKPVKVRRKDICVYDDFADRLVYSDVHIGMNVNPDGHGMYGGKWDEEELMERCDIMVNAVIENRKGQELYIDDLGDVLDGFNGETTRGGHKLPQNMDNEKAFEVGLRFKMHILDNLVPYFDTIIIRNICNDNHAGSFAYVLNHAYKQVAKAKYGTNVEVTNQRKFIDHYFVGDHAFVTSHGKDISNLKFGFKPQLDAKQIEKVDQYIKSTDIYQKAEFVEFSKGDSHQALLDMSGSDDFNYFNYPAFSPSSQWVQTNFKKGRSGFVIQHIDKHNDRIILDPHWFDWKK